MNKLFFQEADTSREGQVSFTNLLVPPLIGITELQLWHVAPWIQWKEGNISDLEIIVRGLR